MNKENEVEEIYIKPENRMSEKDMDLAGFGSSKNTVQPVVEMIEGKTMPVYIFGGPLAFKTDLGETETDIMITLLRHIKEKKLELRGRMRYKDTGKKTVFTGKEMFDIRQYEDAKQTARNMYLKLIKDLPFKVLEVPWELEIPFGTNAHDTIKLMDNSNHFNIGIPEPEKK